MALTDKLVAIADAIRAKTGRPDKMTLDDMPLEIGMIQTGGGDDGSFKTVLEGTAVNPTLPSDLTKIKDYAFYKNSNLSLTSLPSSITSIGEYAFQDCSKLALTSLPSGITSIGQRAFRSCRQLSVSSLPSGITSIESDVFYDCNGIKLSFFPDGLTSISGNAFYGCSGITTTSLPDSVMNIGSSAFRFCKMTHMTIPASVKYVDGYSFGNNTNLASVVFKGTGKPILINSSAFSGCTNLLTINVPWAEGEVANAPWGATNATINYNYTGG